MENDVVVRAYIYIEISNMYVGTDYKIPSKYACYLSQHFSLVLQPIICIGSRNVCQLYTRPLIRESNPNLSSIISVL